MPRKGVILDFGQVLKQDLSKKEMYWEVVRADGSDGNSEGSLKRIEPGQFVLDIQSACPVFALIFSNPGE